MNTDFENGYRTAVFCDVEDSIERAKRGELCNHLQDQTWDELKEYLHADCEYFDAANNLAMRLSQAIASRGQESDFEWESREMKSWGVFEYYYPSDDYWTGMEIIRYLTPKNGIKFSVAISIDRAAAGEDLDGYVNMMKNHFLEWVESVGISISDELSAEDFVEEQYFVSIKDAAEYLLRAMMVPQIFVCGY